MIGADKQKFINECKVKRTYKSVSSSYYIVTYLKESYYICISDHFRPNRNKYFTIISKKRTHKTAKQIAWDYKKTKTKTI